MHIKDDAGDDKASGIETQSTKKTPVKRSAFATRKTNFRGGSDVRSRASLQPRAAAVDAVLGAMADVVAAAGGSAPTPPPTLIT